MKINLLCNKGDNIKFDNINNFNAVVAWSLRKAFRKRGIDCRLVVDKLLMTKPPPKADYNIAISGKALHLIKFKPECRQRLEEASTERTAAFMDSDFGGWFQFFDHIFTVVKPKRKQPEYVYGGWGADPDFFYPEQKEKALYLDTLDCLTKEKHNGRLTHIFDAYNSVMAKTDLTIYNPVPKYRGRKGVSWPDIQDIMRKCHFYCCTQWGESGLTRIEAATSGALLVVPTDIYRPRTMSSLEHKLWSTEEELIDILTSETDVEAIRKKALKHSWDKVVRRMLRAFEN